MAHAVVGKSCVLARLIVPPVLIGPPVSPAPVSTCVTVPDPTAPHVTLPAASMARIADPGMQPSDTRRCKYVVSAAIVPLVEMVPPVSPVPATILVTVPPVAPHPASRKLCTAAGVLRVPVPSARPLVSASPEKPASFLEMIVASATVSVVLPVMLRPQPGQLIAASTSGASTALIPVLITSGAPVMPSA